MTNTELKPCFCGGKAYLHEDYSSGTDKHYYEVYCTNSKCTYYQPATKSAWDGKIFGTDWCDTKSEAVDLWKKMVSNGD